MKQTYRFRIFNVLSLVTVLWLGFFAALLMIGFSFDLRSNPVIGDEASHTLQALSLANDFDLKYNTSDGEHWKNLGWSDKPYGLFYQKYSGGYAFAKPYGYSLFMAIFVFLFGKNGFCVANILIFFLLNLFMFMALKTKYTRLEALLIAFAFSFFSYVYMYVFFIHSDLFLAMLSALFVLIVTKLLDRFSWCFFIVLALLTAFLISEKIVIVLVLSPILFYVLFQYKSPRLCFIFLIILSAGFMVFISPYLYYSDFKSWNPYGGERYYELKNFSFLISKNIEDIAVSSVRSLNTAQHFTVARIATQLFDFSNVKNQALSFYYYFFGAYTGMIVFAPMAFLSFFFVFFSWRKNFGLQAIVLLGLILYILFYVIFFYDNYYGGGQSIGNRYFLQVSPFILLLIIGLGLTRIQIACLVILSGLLSFSFIYRHHFDPQNAFANIDRSGLIQNLMPFETTQEILKQYYINSRKKINTRLYPYNPSYILCNCEESLAYDGKILCVNYSKNHRRKFMNAQKVLGIFDEVKVCNVSVLVNNDFFGNEKTHIWSPKKSKILINTGAGNYNLSLVPYIKGTKVKLAIGDTHRTYNLPVSINIDTQFASRDWVVVEFDADKSGIPKKLGKSTDHRDLSFYLIPEIRFPNRLEVILIK